MLSIIELFITIRLLALLVVSILKDRQSVKIRWSPPLHILIIHFDVFLVRITTQIDAASSKAHFMTTYHSHLLQLFSFIKRVYNLLWSLSELFSERIIRVKVIDQLLHPINLNFECLGSFKVFTGYGFLFSCVQHGEVATNHLQFVSNLLKLDSRIEVFLSHSLLFPLLQNIKFLFHLWIQLVLINALNAEVARSKHRVVFPKGWHLTMLAIGRASHHCLSLSHGLSLYGISHLQRLNFIVT